MSGSSTSTEMATSVQPSPTTPGSIRRFAQMRMAKRKEIEDASSPSKSHQPDRDASPTPTKASNRKGKGRARQQAEDIEGPTQGLYFDSD
ncbi:hypothetical protein N7535_005628 [Penicillium sp. DV-2018c]|nr:hypothetical protein N7461_009202 [Penicillium sp. DV-2018c]KAJ5571968.1 hypothetical protein N7535_005628 [Penicillium sp. DV-2018c]